MSQSKRWLAILAIALSLLLIPTTSWAGFHWQYGDFQRPWGIDDASVCRDGAMIFTYYLNTEHRNDAPASYYALAFQARLYNEVTLAPPEPDVELPPYPLAAYGPMLSAQRTFTMTYHAEPASFVTSTTIYTYTSGPLFWSHPLEPSASKPISVLVEGHNGAFAAPVKDCYLNPPVPLMLDAGASTVIHNDRIPIQPGLTPMDHLAFRLDALPTHGQLLLDGLPLAVGDAFTPQQLEQGQLTYSHDGSLTTDDSMAYSVYGADRVSLGSLSAQANGSSYAPSLAGTSVAFASDATNLVLTDTNGLRDIFVRDLAKDETVWMSVGVSGTQTNGSSNSPALSYSSFFEGAPVQVAYSSLATNLVSGDCLVFDGHDGAQDIFRRSFSPDQARRVSVSQILYGKCYQGNENSYSPSISDASSVAYVSDATNLLMWKDNDEVVHGREDDNGFADIYLTYNDDPYLISIPAGESRLNPTVLANGPSDAPSIADSPNDFSSEDVAFQSLATNLVPGDTNGVADIFVNNYTDTVRVSVSSSGEQANAPAFAPAISRNARFVAFDSAASNLVAGDNNGHIDIFVHDRDADGNGILDEPGGVRTLRLSVAAGGTQANDDSQAAAISYSGRFVAFESAASNLVPGDSNGLLDIFLHDRDVDGNGIFDEPGKVRTLRVSVAADGTQANGASYGPASLSADGTYVAFASDATNLVAGDTNNRRDIFVHYSGYSSILPLKIRPAALQVSPAQLSFSAIGGGANPQAQSLMVQNVGSSSIPWTASEEIPWLKLTHAEGATPASIEVNVDITALTPGTYTGQIKVASHSDSNSPQTVTVTLVVKPNPAIYLPALMRQATQATLCGELVTKQKIWQGDLAVSCDESTHHAGPVSLRLYLASPSIAELYSPLLHVLPSTIYRVSYWVKTNIEIDGADLYGRVIAAEYNSQAIESDAVDQNRVSSGFDLGKSVGGQGDWVEQAYTFRTTANTRYVRLRAVIGGPVGTAHGTAWFDEISLAPN